MSLAGQQLVRCPHCISVQPRGPGGELLLEPGENVCASRNCGRTFMGHQAILEDYPRDGRHFPGRSATANSQGNPSSDQEDRRGSSPRAPLQPALFGGMK